MKSKTCPDCGEVALECGNLCGEFVCSTHRCLYRGEKSACSRCEENVCHECAIDPENTGFTRDDFGALNCKGCQHEAEAARYPLKHRPVG